MSRTQGSTDPPSPGPSPGPPVPARERILAAARRLFYREGIRAVGVEAVVEAAGVTKMSLYRNFASKDELVAAYLAGLDRNYWQWWDKVIARHPQAPREQLRALLSGVARLAARPDFRGCPFTNAAIEFPTPDHPGRRVAEANKRELRRRLCGLAADLGATVPERLGAQLVLLIEGAYVSSQTLGTAQAATGTAAALLAAVDALIRASAPTPGGAGAGAGPRAD